MKFKLMVWSTLGLLGLVMVVIIASCQSAARETGFDASGRWSQQQAGSATPAPVPGGLPYREEVTNELWIIPTEGGQIKGGMLDAQRQLGGFAGGAIGGGMGGGGVGGFGGGAMGGGGPGGTTAGRGRGAMGGRGSSGTGPDPATVATPITVNGAAQEPAAMPIPGSPTLAARQSDGKLVAVPLKHTDVSANITGYIASVGVTQQYHNPYSEKIEAVYVFPLPENAGVSEFVMTIGDRHIRGIIRERAEAQRIYQEARSQGYTASLLNQERPNIFTQSVANIEPGKQIDIQIRYFHTLAYQDGWFEWVFPMVVGPRYNPAGSTDGIGAVAQGSAGISGQSTEVQYLRPEDRSGHDIALKVQLDAGVHIEELVSVNHDARRISTGTHATLVELGPADSIPNKDFVLRYKVAGNQTKTGLFVQRNKEGTGGWFTLMLIPPEELKDLPRRAVEMVFVVDTSGSMSGQPIAQSKAAMNAALSKMVPGDTFQIVRFDSSASQMAAAPLAVSPENIQQARIYVSNLAGGGGTEMLQGISKAMDFPHDEDRTRVVAFLTDGYIGNESQILKALHEKLQESRVFSFGVGSSVNRYLMDAMARLGHGSAAYLALNEPAEPVMDTYFQRISHPAMANIRVEFSPSMKVTDVYPQRIPELFVGKPVILTGRFTGTPDGDVRVRGRAGDHAVTFALPAGGAVEENPAIATVWARMKVADLHDESFYEGRDVSADVRDTALTYGIMSQFTSFVAVDSTRVTTGAHGTTVPVPVPVPDGVRYDTTVQEPLRQ